MLLHQSPHPARFVVPARGADDHILAGFYTGLNVGQDTVGECEINHGIDRSEILCGYRGSVRVFLRAGDANVMLARSRHFRHQGTGFSASENKNIHELLDKCNHNGRVWRRQSRKIPEMPCLRTAVTVNTGLLPQNLAPTENSTAPAFPADNTRSSGMHPIRAPKS